MADIVTNLRNAARADDCDPRLATRAADEIQRWQVIAWQLADVLLETVTDEDHKIAARRRDALAQYWIACGQTEEDL